MRQVDISALCDKVAVNARDVPGCPGLVITDIPVGRGYRLTHEGSGLDVGATVWPTVGALMKAAQKTCSGIDWTRSAKKVVKDPAAFAASKRLRALWWD